MEDHETEEETTVNTQTASQSPSDLGPSNAIGRRLKAYYDDVAGEPVPDRFLSLLDRLDAATGKSGSRD